jgi:hypothetical protein
MLKKANDTGNVGAVCYGDEGFRTPVPHWLDQLQKCQRAQAGSIEKKRAAFPRFYFVSDSVIFEIHGQTSNPHAILPHLRSLFDDLVHLDFDQYRFNRVFGFRSNHESIPGARQCRSLAKRSCAANAPSQLKCPHLTEINGRREIPGTDPAFGDDAFVNGSD